MIRLICMAIDVVISNEDIQDTVWFMKHSKQYIEPKTRKQYVRYLYHYPGAYYTFMKYARADRKANIKER